MQITSGLALVEHVQCIGNLSAVQFVPWIVKGVYFIQTSGTYNISNPHVTVGANQVGTAYQFDGAEARARLGKEITAHSRSVRPIRQEFTFTCEEKINSTKIST